MAIDPTNLTPKAGAGLPAAGYICPPLLRPGSINCIGGTLPADQGGGTIYAGNQYMENRRLYHARRQPGLALLGGHIAVLADSQAEGMPISAIPFAEDFGVGGDTVPGLVYRFRAGGLSSLSVARAVVLMDFPLNDIAAGAADATIQSNYTAVLSYLTGPLVIVPPAPNAGDSGWNTKITTFKTWLNATHGARAQTVIVNTSDLTATIDNIHWTGAVQVEIIKRVQAALRTFG